MEVFMPEISTPTFSGFHSPNYTMVPDQLFDELLVELSGAELKALLYITRRTFGFKRESDAISLAQMLWGITTKDGRVLDRGVGLSKPSLLSALRNLIARNIIEIERHRSAARGDEPTVYRLRFSPAEPKQREVPPVVKKVYHPVVKKVAPQYTVGQDTDLSNIRNESVGEKEREAVYAATTIVADEVPAGTEQGSQVLPRAAHDSKPEQTASASGFVSVSATVNKRRQTLLGKGSAERDGILSRIEQFAQEFGDRASLKSSTSRAYNLFRRSGLSHEQFMHCLWEARAITKERISGAGGRHITAKMGYFFSVLAERLGLQNTPVSDAVTTAKHGPVAF
jgi:Bacteriophage replication protein O